MGEHLNRITVGELLAIMAGVAVVYVFCKNIIIPLVQKWLKIDKTASDLGALSGLPDRVETLEQKVEQDFKRLAAVDEVNELMMEALRALIRNKLANDTIDSMTSLAKVEAKIDGFLIGKVKS